MDTTLNRTLIQLKLSLSNSKSSFNITLSQLAVDKSKTYRVATY